MKLKGLIVGCTSSAAGSSFNSSDGVLGLGHSNISFVNKATARFSGRFSYCLVDHLSPKNASGYLTFGPNGRLNSSAASQTELIMKPTFEPFYAVGIMGISVAGEVLKIPGSVWNLESGGGAIIDSGTSLTVLAEPAYDAVVSALSSRLNGIPRVKVDPFSFCYNWTNVRSGFEVPKLALHFNGSAVFEPPTKSYLIDVEDGVKCVGFVSTPFPGTSTIGNIIQQEHIWEFDIWSRQLRFQPSKCTPY